MDKRKGKTHYALVRWDEDWSSIAFTSSLTIERKKDIPHLKEQWDIVVVCDDQPLPILRKMKELTYEQ